MSSKKEIAQCGQCGQCNVERAYYEGFVIKQSNLEAERWFLEAARDGKPTGSIKA